MALRATRQGVAAVWIDRVPRELAELVRTLGGQLPAGFQLRDVTTMSGDGLTLAGNGVNADGQPEGYRVVLPGIP